ncbi:MAG: NAD-dependent epimerase/dehydratase family protein [Neisseriaceae bacterium]|nr:NAD-dependent epimerase/dehydratase family protein [Neisseriaceae bacterium]
MPQSVFILGLGFLGQPLYQALQQQGWSVAGSRRQGSADDPNQVALNIDASEHAPATMARLLAAEALVCLLPPSGSVHYVDHVLRLVTFMQDHGHLRQVVLASSTSVYGDAVRTCTEATPTAALTASARAIVALEQALLASTLAYVGVLRFGGLFGPTRHPVTVLAQKTAIQGALQPVNVVSQQAAVQAIQQLLAQPLAARQLYNVCHPAHPSKQAFYQAEADRRGLGPLAFDLADDRGGKIVEGRAYLNDYGQVMEDLI